MLPTSTEECGRDLQAGGGARRSRTAPPIRRISVRFPRTISNAGRFARRALPVLAALGVVASVHAGGSTLFHGARILTNDGRGTVVHALLVRDGRVAAVGELPELERRPDAAGAKKVDLGGGVAFPGLVDAHVDLAGMVFAANALDLSVARSYDELIVLVEAAAKQQPKKGTWILGAGWDTRGWSDPALPHHLLLSARTPDHPVFLVSRDGRAALVNQAALELARLAGPVQIDARSVMGRILEDAEGHATGILIDGAMQLVRDVLPPPDPGALQLGLRAAQEQLLARGITAVHDQGTSRETFAALKDLRARGLFLLRVACYLDGAAEFDGASLRALTTPPGNDALSIAGVRFRLDGTLDDRGAALVEPYADAPQERGGIYFAEDDLAKRLSVVIAERLQPSFEAQGDRANRLALDLLERVAAAQGDMRVLRPRLESALLVSTKDWPRVPALAVSVTQMPLATERMLGGSEGRLGPDRVRALCAWRLLAPEIGRPITGSGAPAEDPDPRRAFGLLLQPGTGPVAFDDGLMASPPTPDDVLVGATSGPAWAARQENHRGRLKPGFAADLTVFAADPRLPGQKALAGTDVRLVVIDGAIVWRAQ